MLSIQMEINTFDISRIIFFLFCSYLRTISKLSHLLIYSELHNTKAKLIKKPLHLLISFILVNMLKT